MLEKTMRMNYLFDFYQILLTERQKEYMQMYYLEDYSLVEIANEANVSRQAVYDNIKRTEAILETYESQLKLYEKFTNRINLLDKLEKAIKDEEDARENLKIIQKLKDLG